MNAKVKVARPKSPRYQQLADRLATEIGHGRYPVGSVLPGEHDWVARYRVSRYTVREALRRLSEWGLITRARGVGTVVIARDRVKTTVQHLGSPAEVMRYPAGSRLQAVAVESVTVEGELAQRMRVAPGEGWHRVSAMRYLVSGGAPIGWSDIFLPADYAAVASFVGRRAGQVFEFIEKRYGRRVQRVEVEIRPVSLDAQCAKGLQVAEGAPALEVLRRYLGGDNELLLCTVARHPAERFTYAFDLRRAEEGSAWVTD
jgi:GntR family transcriptional regulator